MVILLLSHHAGQWVELVLHLLGRVHLQLEEGQGLEGEGDVEEGGGGVDRHVVPVQIPVVIEPHDGLILL